MSHEPFPEPDYPIAIAATKYGRKQWTATTSPPIHRAPPLSIAPR
ncbi:hypothetical protein QUA56_08645 [Microcoleus sp. N3A4]